MFSKEMLATADSLSLLLLQGLLGHLLFAEQISSKWAAGITLVTAGLVLISKSVVSPAEESAAAAAAATQGHQQQGKSKAA
jgi:hypothetical protein